MKTILITGANGFIARELAARFKENSWRVIGTARRPATIGGFDATYACALGQSLDPVFASEPVDAIVHAANDSGPGEYDVNVEGTTRWLAEARARSVTRHVFLSSLSAVSGVDSEYGRAKQELERRFVAEGGVVVRLGLVVGPSGIFGRMIDSVRRFRVLPLLDSGASPVYVVGPRFLTGFVADCVRSESNEFGGRIWQIHQPRAHALREVMEAIRTHCGVSCRFIAVPSWPILCALAVAERIPGLRLPVTSTNIRGLRAARHHHPHSDLERLGGVEEPLSALVAQAVREADGRRARSFGGANA